MVLTGPPRDQRSPTKSQGNQQFEVQGLALSRGTQAPGRGIVEAPGCQIQCTRPLRSRIQVLFLGSGHVILGGPVAAGFQQRPYDVDEDGRQGQDGISGTAKAVPVCLM